MSRSKLVAQTTAMLSRSHYIKSVVPRAQPGALDVLAAPFYGPLDGKDEHGEYFSPNTNFQADLIPLPPVFYYHGAETGSTADPIGRAAERWEDNLGVWFRVDLDMARPEARRVWQAAQTGSAYASTGGIPASIVVDPSGEIRQWLIGELSLMDLDEKAGRAPANRYAIAMPRMKALLDGLSSEQRQLFDAVYQVDATDTTGGQTVDVIEILQAIFARVIEELAAAMGTDPAAAAETVTDAAEGAADEAGAGEMPAESDAMTEDEKCAGCKASGCQGAGCAGCKGCMGDDQKGDMEVSGAVDEIMDALGLDDPMMSKSKAFKALVAQNTTMRRQLAEREDGDWLKDQIAAFRVTPAESEATLRALAQARSADARSKAADLPTVKAVKALIEARPAKFARQDLPGKGLKLAGFQTPQDVQQRVDEAYMQRVRRLAGLPEKGA